MTPVKEIELNGIKLCDMVNDPSDYRLIDFAIREAREAVHRLHGGIEVDPSLCQHPECWRLWH